MGEFENIESFASFAPEWGIVLGSGLSGIVSRVEICHCVPFQEVSGLPAARVPGHAGRLIAGTFAGKRVLISQGRLHLYEGHTARDVTATVRLMAEAGVSKLLLTNAAGVVNPGFSPGNWMIIEDHLNLTHTSPLVGAANFVDMSEIYSGELRRRFMEAATRLEIPLHSGVYAGVLGPQYETPAEVRMLQRLGADAVGMSTVLEAIQARALDLRVAGFSCLANWAAGMSAQALSHSEVLSAVAGAADRFGQLLEGALAVR